jgi:hypothetical protein
MKKERKTGRGEDGRMKIIFNVYYYYELFKRISPCVAFD